eukprot:2732500-Pyramimonas_sp.AAC.2
MAYLSPHSPQGGPSEAVKRREHPNRASRASGCWPAVGPKRHASCRRCSCQPQTAAPSSRRAGASACW